MKKQTNLISAVALASLIAISTQLMPLEVPTPFSVLASVGERSAESLTVTSAADSGPGTLRQVLLDAQPGDTITFDLTIFPPVAPVTITLTAPLPVLTQGNLTLDASSAGVVLDGSQLSGEDVHGLDIDSDGNVVRGLEIFNFPGAAVGLREGVSGNVVRDNLLSGNGSFGIGVWGAETTDNTLQDNIIGTNRSGQAAGGLTRDGIHIYAAGQNTVTGNLIAGVGQSGIYICCGGAGNTVSNNVIGLAVDGTTPLGNGQAGITIDQGAHDTVIGPENVIADNPVGVAVTGVGSVGNTITQNRIYSNTEGISLFQGGNGEPRSPAIIGFDLSAGTIEGVTCAHCSVEVFSTHEDQGDVYEGQASADAVGYFLLNKGSALAGPYLTATATDAAGNTSGFSRATSGERRGVNLQEGNTHSKTFIPARPAPELADNGLGDMVSLHASVRTADEAAEYLATSNALGFKHKRLSLDYFDWSEVITDEPPAYSQSAVDPIHDQLITDLVNSGVTIHYCLVYWDDQIEPVEVGYARFKDEQEIQRYLDYARFIVRHFKGRIEYYEILNETCFHEGSSFTQQNVELPDFVNLITQVTAVIHEEDPDAKIIAGAAPSLSEQAAFDYQMGILSSDAIMPIVDAVAWHPGPYPVMLGGAVDHLYRVPETIQEIQSTAAAHGFQGEYLPYEIQWPTAYNPTPSQPWNVYSETVSAKYFGRGILDHQGLGMVSLLAGTAYEGNLPKMDVIRNLANLLAGAKATPLPLQVQSTLTDVVSYTFTDTGNDSYLVALWQDGFATNEIEPGTPLTLTIPGITATLQLLTYSDLSVTGYDVLHNFQQPLEAHMDGTSLVISNLQVRDYPLMLRLAQIRYVFLPIVLRNLH
jgi:parallel beta-helix repeat protein